MKHKRKSYPNSEDSIDSVEEKTQKLFYVFIFLVIFTIVINCWGQLAIHQRKVKAENRQKLLDLQRREMEEKIRINEEKLAEITKKIEEYQLKIQEKIMEIEERNKELENQRNRVLQFPSLSEIFCSLFCSE
ncbi:hypothetical protein XENTR_v10004123 [Xenopus tropicalis]|nr:hypothetical protein XENTR_v10004123 [Xenopus tropicalis]